MALTANATASFPVSSGGVNIAKYCKTPPMFWNSDKFQFANLLSK